MLYHLLHALITALLARPERIIVSRYADTPRDEGGTPACWRRMPDEDFDRMYPRRCAHRTLPCGTTVYVKTSVGQGVCYVLDRGPFGRRPDGTYRGNLDLSPLPAADVGIWSAAGRSESPGRLPARMWLALPGKR